MNRKRQSSDSNADKNDKVRRQDKDERKIEKRRIVQIVQKKEKAKSAIGWKEIRERLDKLKTNKTVETDKIVKFDKNL